MWSAISLDAIFGKRHVLLTLMVYTRGCTTNLKHHALAACGTRERTSSVHIACCVAYAIINGS